MFEVELKFHVPNPDVTRRSIDALGATVASTCTHADTYFNHPCRDFRQTGEALRIRWTPTYLVIAPDLTVQGFRTGLADAGELAVKDFVQDIAETRAGWDAS